jgi:hypothetical protein
MQAPVDTPENRASVTGDRGSHARAVGQGRRGGSTDAWGDSEHETCEHLLQLRDSTFGGIEGGVLWEAFDARLDEVEEEHRVVDQARRRVFRGDVHVAEKILSIFEPHTRVDTSEGMERSRSGHQVSIGSVQGASNPVGDVLNPIELGRPWHDPTGHGQVGRLRGSVARRCDGR